MTSPIKSIAVTGRGWNMMARSAWDAVALLALAAFLCVLVTGRSLASPCNDPFADVDGDGDVDQSDFGLFQVCLTGDGGGVLAGCDCFDRPEEGSPFGDNDVDGDDLLAFEACAIGPGIPADPECDLEYPNWPPDYWVTVEETGRTYYELSVPADFFGDGSEPFGGKFYFKGDPLDPATTGDVSMIILRSTDPALPDDPVNTQGTADLQIAELSLLSAAPIVVVSNGRLEEWDVKVGLSPTTAPVGTLNAKKTHDNGGRFGATPYVHSLLTFTKVDEPEQVRTLDTAAEDMDPLEFTTEDAPFVHELSPDLADNILIAEGAQFIPGVEQPDPGDISQRTVFVNLEAASVSTAAAAQSGPDPVFETPPSGSKTPSPPLAVTSSSCGAGISATPTAPPTPCRIFVDDDAPNDPGPGDPEVSDPDEDGSVVHPFNTIQEALDEAANRAGLSYSTIWVEEGTYAESINFNGVACTLRSMDPDDPAVVAATIIRAGDALLPVVRFTYGESPYSVLTGFTIDGTFDDASNAQHGIRCEYSSPTITNCTVHSNTNAGVSCNHCDPPPAISGCTIRHNGGCGINGEFSPASVHDCIVHDNGLSGINASMWAIIPDCTVYNNCKQQPST